MKLTRKQRKLALNILTIAIPIISVATIYFGLGVALAIDKPLVAVVGGSMSPALEAGDLVIVQGIRASKIQVEDVIVFDPPQGVRTIHRVTRIQTLPNGTFQFKTRGDAVDHEDRDWISEQYVDGRVIYRIPYLGYLILVPTITIVVVIIIVIIILIWPEKKRVARRHKGI